MTEIISTVKCKNCGSEAVVKFGSYKGVQRYYCKVCKRKFKGDNALFHMKASPEYVTSALSMYYSGLSIDDICDHMKQEHGYYPSKHVVHEWIDKFTPKAIEQFKDAQPKVGDTWVADETVLWLDKKTKVWFFDIIDSETRYLIASRASLSRTTRDAQMLIDRAVKRAGKNPKVIVTDKLASYLDVNYGKDAEHRQGSPFRVKVSGESTAQIERFHGTIKDRTKVMRAFRDMNTLHQFMEGYLVYYNFFKPHEALNGKTPAEAAKVDYQIKNWKDLCQSSITKRAEPETKKTGRIRITTIPAKESKEHRRSYNPRMPRMLRSSEIDVGSGISINKRTGRGHIRLI
ncbi:MAG: DDE-type integrase/transposase/recombinase [Dehalococcoidales bacterium]|nr:DDE-type integrase/transposase/recombinase [Dehalococcoidales bacterium]